MRVYANQETIGVTNEDGKDLLKPIYDSLVNAEKQLKDDITMGLLQYNMMNLVRDMVSMANNKVVLLAEHKLTGEINAILFDVVPDGTIYTSQFDEEGALYIEVPDKSGVK